ncbi:hypothetical protein TthHB5008_00600 [Thermus thermophilus]|uniref:Uncharacterized protein n=1 Tax=Thermus thermophilus TaxID=274 RepID=A0A7R7THX5_THETH|nr:hypothetical protein [Thermus thermophilus]BCP65126.1 hypothetical protein TthHB5018_00600 [Thermus thermophilus]BCP96957.1 hypothetical protein TthHB5002_00600 [Thermus thermophilus]BCP99289.1 hypothetical protein TthHB5008_00600 [Thermus thermophilus]BDG22869.1 hypothetical protein TthSNM33_00630 [Thermus thermophilus]BDG25425.1 hypothetical protein TthSNM66_00610 [Thermus thermophilus]
MEVQLRRARRAMYLRLAAWHAGPLGLAWAGRPELAPRYPEAYARCGGAPGLACAGVGGEPRVCLVRRLERLARSAERGGRRRRAQEKALVEELLLCVGHLQKELPPEFLPLLEATEKALRQDLDYLRSVASAPLSPEQKGQDQGQGP